MSSDWKKLSGDFPDLLRNRCFIMAVSGENGRYVPSAESTRQILLGRARRQPGWRNCFRDKPLDKARPLFYA